MKENIVKVISSLPVQVLSRLILGGMFIYAGLTKVVNLEAFANIIHNYKILPAPLVTIAAIVLPWTEIISGILLVLGLYKRASATALSLMLLIFIVAISYNLMRGLNFDCGCFSPVATETGSDPVGLLIRDFFSLIPGIIIIFWGDEKRSWRQKLQPEKA
jgi:putative oxidoreductase